MLARIYQPARSAMQSGQAKTRNWVLEFAPASARKVEPMMGWTSSNDMNAQVRLSFESREAAIDYARARGIAYQVSETHKRKPIVRNGGYGENFASDRRAVWTH
jgi:ETC complex I subunit-like protein